MRRVAIATAVFALFSSAISAASAQTTTGSQLNPCAVPNEVGASFEEAAWQIFVAATCPVNNDQYPFVVWENWIEQAGCTRPTPSRARSSRRRAGSMPGARSGAGRASLSRRVVTTVPRREAHFIRVKKKGPVANPTYAGIFQADAFGGYNRLYEADRKPGQIVEAACWVHARRPFFRALGSSSPTPSCSPPAARSEPLSACGSPNSHLLCGLTLGGHNRQQRLQSARLARCSASPEGPLTELTAGAQPWPRERVLMPSFRPPLNRDLGRNPDYRKPYNGASPGPVGSILYDHPRGKQIARDG